jgi:type II secretory pathway component PulF
MDISERLEGGALVSEACSEHRQVFGDLLLEFVRMGEQGYALRDSLVKYRELRDGLDQISGTYRIEGYIRVPPLFNYTTRAFALTFGTVLEMSDDVKRSVRCAAFECRPGIRKRLAESLALIRAGESIGDVLPERSFWRSGFEAGFIDLIRNADEQSRLTKTLLACSRM